jgi:hypothetical protein
MNLNWLKSFINVSNGQTEQYILVDVADKGKIQDIKSAIAQSETGLALDCLSALNIKSIENETILLNSRFQSLQNDQIAGILTSDEYRLQENRIHQDLLTLTGRLEKSLEPEKIIREIKVNLRKRYQKRYKDKLADRLPINIQCAYSIEGTGHEYAEVAFDKIVLTQNQVRENIEHIFDRHRGRLLIIGEPGAGKTTLLLQLAEALLQRPENRVPVILNLSTWRGQHKNLTHWLLHNVPAAAAVSRSMAKRLVLEDRLLPLFDGLDEVLAEHRNSCLKAISEYGDDANHQYVICSRTHEYGQTNGAPVFGQVKLLPLSQEQIIQHLENSTQPEARFLLNAVKTQPLLAKVIEAPFYFNTTQLLLASMKSLDDLDIRAENEVDMKEALVEKFIQEKLNTPIRWAFPAENSGKWLGFLAKNMEEKGLTNFELADLNLDWLGRKKWRYFLLGAIWIYLGILTYNSPLIDAGSGFISGAYNIQGSEMKNFISFDEPYRLVGLSISFVFWVFFSAKRFNTSGGIDWKFKNVTSKIRSNSLKWLIGAGLLFVTGKFTRQYVNVSLSETEGILFVLIAMFLLVGRNPLFWILFILIMISVGKAIHLMGYALQGIPFFFTYIMLAGLTRIIRAGIEWKKADKTDNPYSRILNTTKVQVLFFLVIMGSFALIFYILLMEISQKSPDTSTSDIDDLISMLLYFSTWLLIVKHFMLRFILAITSSLPYRLATFLKEMDARHIFESDGGSWRFRHKILQDYFVHKYSSTGIQNN